MKLFQTARRFELTLQPQLILLQKTLLNIEGVGRLLDPEIDIWAVAHPILKRILRQRYSPRRSVKNILKRLPEWLYLAPQLPDLLHETLQHAARGEQRPHHDTVAMKQQQQRLAQHLMQTISSAVLGATLILSATLLWMSVPALNAWWLPLLPALSGLLIFAWSLLRRHRH